MPRGPLAILLLRLALVMVLYSVLRLLFWLLNTEFFPAPPPMAFLGGLRFDMSAVAWTNLPWALLVLIKPVPGRAFARVQFGVFIALNAIALFFNCVDLGYYAFTLRRTTSDFIGILFAGGDTLQLAPAFLRDYWHLALLYLGCLWLLQWGYRRIGRHAVPERSSVVRRIAWRVAAVALIAVGSRGGLQDSTPVQVLDAARYGGTTYLPVVLNTPFTMLMSLGKPVVEEKHYMTQEEADALWPVRHDYNDPFSLGYRPPKRNVAIIILESFSAAYSGRLSGGEGCTPFLDSLMGHGLNFTRAYANGRRSIDGIPAILAGMPELMDEAFLLSRYAGMPFTSLASVLGPEGYASSFYHGGRNGTMGFDSFTRSAGFERYVGLNEYTAHTQQTGAGDHDGHWGIKDGPFLQFWARELAKERQPFLSVAFTLSSHHPYALAKEDAERFSRPGDTHRIMPTLRYTDDALRRFFATARTMPWYDSTIFVITADHTADLKRDGQHYDKAIDYWVPLLFFAPGRIGVETTDRVAQHIDILPTVLDLLHHDKPFFSFGHSALRPSHPDAAVMASNRLYFLIGDSLQIVHDGERMLPSKPLTDPPLTGGARERKEAEMLRRLQAAIQQFNGHLLRGELTAKPTVQ